jgi:L-fucose isomerase-like protein
LKVDVDINPLPLHDAESIDRELRLLAENPPSGLLVTAMHLESWPRLRALLGQRGEIPTIVFGPLGTALPSRTRKLQGMPRTFVATTQDHKWLATGVRMLKAAWELPQTRICIVSDAAEGDQRIGKIGSTLHYVPLSRWIDELRDTPISDEVREIAKAFAIEARDVVEPELDDILSAARNYVVARRIMKSERCQGISVDCAQLVGEQHVACGPCLAWSKLLDEGLVGGCEADADAAVTLLLAMRLFDRPGFMQDATANTVSNTLVASHCTCATRLCGYDQPPATYRLRSHFESDTGVAMQVQWPIGETVTLLKYQRPDTMWFGTGRVLDNVQASFAGGCRTAVEIELDDLPDARDLAGHHQVLVCGEFDNLLRAYCALSDLKPAHIGGARRA